MMGPFQILLLLFFCFAVNLPFYGLQNRNIASNSNGNIKTAFWLGLMGPLGMIICLIQNVKPTWKKVLFGIGRVLLWAIVSQIIVELGIFSQVFVNAPILYFFGFPFIMRGKYIYRFSVKKQ